jgi:lipopolysaccharide/colanic/teichoic acid biosynthesis glycosyltransferase
MKKNRSASRNASRYAARPAGSLLYILTAVITASLGLLLAVRLPAETDAALRWRYTLALAGLFMLLAFALVNVLSGLGLSTDKAGRGALLGAFLLALLYWISAFGFGTGAVNFWLLPAMGLAACLGGFLAGMLLDGFVENNAPPSQNVKEDVLRWHMQAIGNPSVIPYAKRVFDIILAGLGMLVSMPLWLSFGLLIWLESPGPVVFVKNSVGKGGHNFHQYKFRTMVRGAEQDSGPVLAEKKDGRVLRIGAFLRKSALDELPQLVNILKGEMSFVGPRPQRTVLVHQYLQDVPDYALRHRFPPGLAGLAQVAAGYYISPREKLKWDLLYIERASLKYDLWLLALAFVLVFWIRWRKDAAEGGLPYHWLRLDQDVRL